jgi:hypothetical protein
VNPIETANYAFTLRLACAVPLDEKLEDALFVAGCDDALISSCDGSLQLAFDRTGGSLSEAVISAIQDVERSGLGLTILEVAPAGADEIARINAALRLRELAPDLLQRLSG